MAEKKEKKKIKIKKIKDYRGAIAWYVILELGRLCKYYDFYACHTGCYFKQLSATGLGVGVNLPSVCNIRADY